MLNKLLHIGRQIEQSNFIYVTFMCTDLDWSCTGPVPQATRPTEAFLLHFYVLA